MNLTKLQEAVEDRRVLWSMGLRRVGHDLTTKQQEQTEDLFYTITLPPPSVGSFDGLNPLFREAKKQIKTLKAGDVSQWLSDQDAYTLHRPARVHLKRNKTIVSKVDAQWQADLVDMEQFAWYNKGYKYILVCIDILSKYCWVKVLKAKTGKEVAKAFYNIFKQDR